MCKIEAIEIVPTFLLWFQGQPWSCFAVVSLTNMPVFMYPTHRRDVKELWLTLGRRCFTWLSPWCFSSIDEWQLQVQNLGFKIGILEFWSLIRTFTKAKENVGVTCGTCYSFAGTGRTKLERHHAEYARKNSVHPLMVMLGLLLCVNKKLARVRHLVSLQLVQGRFFLLCFPWLSCEADNYYAVHL